MKITDVTPILTRPSDYHDGAGRTRTFVQVDTDEGISGIGEATNYPGGGSLIVGHTEALIGELAAGGWPNRIGWRYNISYI